MTPTGASLEALQKAGVKDAIPMGRFAFKQASFKDSIRFLFKDELAEKHRGYAMLVGSRRTITTSCVSRAF